MNQIDRTLLELVEVTKKLYTLGYKRHDDTWRYVGSRMFNGKNRIRLLALLFKLCGKKVRIVTECCYRKKERTQDDSMYIYK